jgi:hypothetical protein
MDDSILNGSILNYSRMRNLSRIQREASQDSCFYPPQNENVTIEEDSRDFYTSEEESEEDV